MNGERKDTIVDGIAVAFSTSWVKVWDYKEDAQKTRPELGEWFPRDSKMVKTILYL